MTEETTVDEPLVRQLHMPDDVEKAAEAIEVVRGWVIDKHLQCSISASVFADHAQWGILLADLAQHIAGAMHEVHKVDQQETLQKIVTAFTNAINDAQAPDA
jgi:hypothetical protein